MSYPPTMPTRKTDLETIEAVLRQAGIGTVKHHEVSLALAALERVEQGRHEKTEPISARALVEAEAGILAGDMHTTSKYLPVLVDAYRRLHKLGR